MSEGLFALSLIQLTTLSLSKLSLLQRMSSNSNDKHKLEEEAKSSTARKRLQLFDDDSGDDDCSDSPEEKIEEEDKMEEEVSSEESSMNQLDTSNEKLLAKHGCGIVFDDDNDTTSPLSEPRTTEMPSSREHSDPDSSNDVNGDNF
jgi:hypothetical protein